MASLQEEVKRNRKEALELQFQNSSRSQSMNQLADTSTLRIGSLIDFSGTRSAEVEVMSFTDQPMEPTPIPGPSSTNDHSESVLGLINNLLTEDSEAELDNDTDEDLSGLLSESEDEKESPKLPLNWAEDE
jgi:hypothetical protein